MPNSENSPPSSGADVPVRAGRPRPAAPNAEKSQIAGSSRRGLIEAALVCLSLALLIASAAWWFFQQGYTLYYGDAQSHLNLSRSVIDSRTPGYDQLGTVWLPVLHLICLPLVANNRLWSSGLAGTIPVALCFVIAGSCFYLAAKDVYRSSLAAVVVVSCFALNPNILYLASIPMTEVVFLAGLAAMLLALIQFRRSQTKVPIILGIIASWSMSLTRYDGWFLIPFASLYFALFARNRRWIVLIAFAASASLAPLYWIGHNWWETGNPLDFYNGPYSAIAIQGAHSYPGYHDWTLAAGYYAKAGQLCAGWFLIAIGAAGMIFAVIKKTLSPILFLMLTPVFYIWSIHSSGTPIFLPQLQSRGYYNSRYGIAVVALAAFAAGAIVLALPTAYKKWAALLPLLSLAPWLLHPTPGNWICWKESQVNSVSRRAWTNAGTDFFRNHYSPGEGILTPSASGDLAGIFCRKGIPLRDTINVGNGPAWFANTRPDLVHQALWAVSQAGDPLANALSHDQSQVYSIASEIQVKGAPPLQIYRRK